MLAIYQCAMPYPPLARKAEKHAHGRPIPALPAVPCILAGEQLAAAYEGVAALRRAESVSSGMHIALHTYEMKFPAIPSCGARISGAAQRTKPAGAQRHVVQIDNVMQMLNSVDLPEQRRKAVQSCIVNRVPHLLLVRGRGVQLFQKDFLACIASAQAADWLYLFSTEKMESFVLRKFPVSRVILHTPQLKVLELAFNGIVYLDVSQCSQLLVLSCTDNCLTELFLRAMPHLQQVNLLGNRLARVVISECAALESANLRRNPIESIKIDKADKLRRLEIDIQDLVYFSVKQPIQEMLSSYLLEARAQLAERQHKEDCGPRERAHILAAERLYDYVLALQDQIYALQMAEETAREEAEELRARCEQAASTLPQECSHQAEQVHFLREQLGRTVARQLGRGY